MTSGIPSAEPLQPTRMCAHVRGHARYSCRPCPLHRVMEEKQEYVTASGAAQVTGLSLRTIITRLGRGEIAGAEAIQLPGRPREWRIPRSALTNLQRLPSSIEERVAALEQEVARLRRLLEAAPEPGTPAPRGRPPTPGAATPLPPE